MKKFLFIATLLLSWLPFASTSAQDVVEIGTVEQLKDFRDAVNANTSYAGKIVRLTANLDLSGESNWEPIGNVTAYPSKAFKGTFDGNGKTISNLKVDDQTVNWGCAGLFGSISNGTIQNLTVTNVDIKSHHYAGGIVAYKGDGTNVTIENCHVNGGTIVSTPELVGSGYDNGDKVGGIVGYSASPITISNCIINGLTMTAYRDLGSVGGYVSGTVSDCEATNVTLIQDDDNGYKSGDMMTTVGLIVGGRSTNAANINDGTTGNNTATNVTIQKAAPAVAQIGTTKYETLQAAVAAAEDGATIQVIKAGEYAIPAITKNLTIEATVNDVVVNHEANSAITTIASGKTATFKNITFDLGTLALPIAHGFGTTNGSNGALVMDGCTINGALNLFGASTLANCTFNAEGIYNIWAVNDNATFTGCTFTNTNRAVNVYDQKKSSTTKNVSFSNCTFAGSAKKKAAVNIHHNPDGTAAKYAVSITACTTTGTWASTVEETGEPDGSTICYSPLWMISDIVNWNDGDIAVTVDGVAQDVSKFSPVAQIGETKYTSLAEAVAAVPADGTETTITMIADETINNNAGVTIAAGKNIVLDLNGKSIVQTAPEAKTAATITNKGTLTIEDTAGGGSISMTGTPDANWLYGIWVIDNRNNLVINGGTIINNSARGLGFAVHTGAYGTSTNVEVNGGTISHPNYCAFCVYYQHGGSQVVNIKGGSFIGSASPIWYQICTDNPNIDMTISGGEIISTSDRYSPIYVWAYGSGFDATNAKMSITGGYINTNGVSDIIDWDDQESAFVNLNKKVITGGTFSVDPTANLAEGYISTDLGDGTYGVVQGSYVAQIGDTKYTSLAAAVAAVPTDGIATTITMIDNEIVAAGTTMTIAAGKNIVLDLNGKTITGSSTTSAPNFYFITNKGILEITDNSNGTQGKITYVCSSATYSNEYVTICNEGGTFTLTKGTVENTGGGLSYAVNNRSVAPGTATFNLNGGTISAPSGDAALRVYQSIYNSNSPYANKVNIAGGTILDTGIFVDTYISSSLADGNNAQIAINISEGTVNGLIDLKIRHPFNTLLNITGGDFSNSRFRVRKYTSEYVNAYGEPTVPMVTISGGTFAFANNYTAFGLNEGNGSGTTWTSYEKAYAISGGVFDQPVPEGFCAESYVPAENTDATTSQAYPYTVELPMSERDIELVDGQPYTFTQDTQVKSVTYKRTLSDGNVNKYLSWYVPFNYTITTEDAENFTFYKINMIANSPNPSENTNPDKIWIFLTQMSAGETLKANKPYIFKSNTSGEFTFTTQNATLCAPASGPRMETSTSLCEFAFYGTYAPKSLQGTNYYYMGSKGALSRPVDYPQTIGSYRWYIVATSKVDEYAPVFVFTEDLDDDATGISQKDNVVAEESYYNLNGMRINKPANGAYIIKYSDGSVKKVAVK